VSCAPASARSSPRSRTELAGAASSVQELWPLLHNTQPNVVLLDLHHPGRDGLSISLEIKRRPDAPAVVLYSSNTDDATVVAAALAGASAVVSKSSSSESLLETIRTVARAPHLLPQVSLRMRREAAARLAPADRPILAMRLAG
jgi:DNA-binding NarL/FixJ family response regulator